MSPNRMANGGGPQRFTSRHTIDRDILLVPDQLIDDYAKSLDEALHPIFDAVWQSAGWHASSSFDEDDPVTLFAQCFEAVWVVDLKIVRYQQPESRNLP